MRVSAARISTSMAEILRTRFREGMDRAIDRHMTGGAADETAIGAIRDYLETTLSGTIGKLKASPEAVVEAILARVAERFGPQAIAPSISVGGLSGKGGTDAALRGGLGVKGRS